MYDINWKWLDKEEFKELVKDLYWFEVELYDWYAITNQGESIKMFSVNGVDYKTIHYDYSLIGFPFKDWREMTPEEIEKVEVRLQQYVSANNEFSKQTKKYSMREKEVYNKLMEYQEKYPALTFDNDGYEYLPMEVRETHKVQIAEIEVLLKSVIQGFVKFNNFKPRRDGSFSIRHQCYWDETFIGVGYLDVTQLKD